MNNSLTLDSVMQAPGRPDEDLRGGFDHGGYCDLPAGRTDGGEDHLEDHLVE